MMKTITSKVLVVILLAVIAPIAVVGWNDEMKDGRGQNERRNLASNPTSTKTIVEVAVVAPEFESLVAALTAADLVDALSGSGPFTVFAPTDAAFAALPDGTLDTLLDPSNLATLQDILKYHVVSGKYPKCNIRGGVTTMKTLNGDTIKVKKSYGKIFVNGIRASLPDIVASNGIIYKINGVLTPPS